MTKTNAAAEQGLVMVYTGNGRGKTTAAMGQAVRALGHGYRVFIIHFLKGRDYGEYLAFKDFAGVEIVRAGREQFIDRNNPAAEDIDLTRAGFERARDAIYSREFHLVIMDEINVAMHYSLVAVDEVITMLNGRPPGVDVILTGRYAPAEIIATADMVSEIKEIKHHYQAGIKSRKGIEY